MSNSNSSFVPRNEHDAHAFFQDNNFNNNAFGGFDPALANGASHHDDLAFANNNSWGYTPEQVGGLNHGHDPQASLYPGWHNSSHTQHELNFQPTPDSFNGFHGNSFAQQSGTSNGSGFDGSNDFRYPMQSDFGMSNGYNAALAGNTFQSNSPAPYSQPPSQLNTISPGALQSRPASYLNASSSMPAPAKRESPKPKLESPAPEVPKAQLPKGTATGKFVIISPESLAKSIQCRRFHNFLHIGDQSFDVPITKTTIPAYIPRKSRNEIKKLLAGDSGLTAKLTKKPRKGSIIAPKSASRRSETPTTKPPRPVKSGSSPSSDEFESSDDESDSESEEESMHPPIPATRPTRALDAAKYDTIKALWRVPYRSVEGDDIRKGLTEFWNIIRTIRDRWKSDSAAVKEAEETKKANDLPLLKERVMLQREMLEAVLEAALAEGHRDIVEHLGENLPLVLALSQFLADRARETEYSGTLSLAILKLLARCITLTEGNLEKTGVGKVLPRIQKRGDDQAKSLAKRIIDNAHAASKKRKDPVKSTAAVKDAKAAAATSTKTASPVAGVKRARPGEGGNDQPVKKLAGDPGAAKAAATVRRPAADAKATGSAATTPAPAVKKAVVPTKPSGFFQSLQSAKRPNTAANVSATYVKPAEKPAAASVPPPKPAGFSFADAMASLNKPKEPEPAAKREESAGPPETPEEKAKRLRKEARRKLRVSWKPDASLEQIREFVHDPEEEYGFDPNQVRDAADIDSEGRMFKMKSHEDLMDVDDEEDEPEAPPSELDNFERDFPEPSAVDFSVIPQDDRDKLFAPYGGGTIQPTSADKAVQEQREANNLIAIYADRSDIPPTPKEPPESTEEATQPKSFGKPLEWVQKRLDKVVPPGAVPAVPPVLAALLGNIPQMPQQANMPAPPMALPFSQPTQQQNGQAAPNQGLDLTQIFANFAQQPPQPQAPMQPPQQQQAGAVPDMSTLFANLAQQQPNQAQQPTPQQGVAQPAAPPPPADINAILQALTQNSAANAATQFPASQNNNNDNNNSNAANPVPSFPQMPQMPGMPPMSNMPPMQGMPPMPPMFNNSGGMPDVAQTNFMLSAMGLPTFPPNFNPNMLQPYNQGSQQQFGGFENPERARLMAGAGGGDDDNDNGGYGGDHGGGRGDKGKGGGGKNWKKGKGVPYKVVACQYWQQGKCRKGDACTYRHDGPEGGG